MSTLWSRINTLFLLLVLIGIIALFAQRAASGPLDPPAPPGSTMKTLQEVEPRTPVQSLPGEPGAVHVISQSGSYYLTGNIAGASGANGIWINASNVSLDLNGFTLTGVPDSLNGIIVSPVSNVHVHNGTVRDWGLYGLNAGSNASHFDHLRAINNGADGLAIGFASVLEQCESRLNGGDGIQAAHQVVVRGCTANDNVGDGIVVSHSSVVTQCVASGNDLNGVKDGGRTLVTGCTANNNGGDGILTGGTSTVRGCHTTFNSGDGIEASGHDRIEGNHAANNGVIDGAGIHAPFGGNEIIGNSVYGNDRGIDLDGASNLVVGNSAANNGAPGVTDEYVIVAQNTVGPIVDDTNIATSNNPHANYHHP